MHVRRFLVPVFTGVILALSLAGCGGQTAGFEDVKWELESYGETGSLQPVIEGTTITATFDSSKRQVSGSAGCNTYFGDYKIDDGLTVSMLANTEMYCMDPEGVMDQEKEYLDILQQAKSYKVSGDRLEIDCGDNTLVFKPAVDTD
jgi:heat shock protein HslJ